MKCHQCNKIIEDYEKICPHCGYFHDPDLETFYRDESYRKEASKVVEYDREKYHPKGKRGVSAILSLYKNTFNFTGVSDRGEFWTQYSFLIFFVIFYFVMNREFVEYGYQITFFNQFLLIFSAILIILTVLPIVSATVRRLHDAGYSGVWYLVNYIPIIGGLILLVLLVMPYQRNQYNDWLEKKNSDKSIGHQVSDNI